MTLVRSLSIVIPAFNEEARLPKTLDRILAWSAEQSFDFFEILVVDDGSRDNTVQVAGRHPQVRVLVNPGNRGKGYSVRHGMTEARGDWRLFTDADLSAPIEEFCKLSAAVENGADAAIGSRAVDRSLIAVHQPPLRELAGRFFNVVMKIVMRLPIDDTQCGFKLFSRAAAEAAFSRQRLERFGFDVEILYLLRKHGFRIAEVPVRWSDVAGTKVSMFTGAQGFLDLLEIRKNQITGKYK